MRPIVARASHDQTGSGEEMLGGSEPDREVFRQALYGLVARVQDVVRHAATQLNDAIWRAIAGIPPGECDDGAEVEPREGNMTSLWISDW